MINPFTPNYASTPASALRPRFGYAPGTHSDAPAVSIVTPYYNVGPVFHETAATVFAQSLQNWEWLIVNDGSSEAGSLAVLDEYRVRDPRVRVIDLPENRGVPAARNEGFRQARAEFVLQLDGDDLIEPTMLEKCAWFLATHDGYAFVKGYTVGFGGQEYLWTRGFHDTSVFLTSNLVTCTALVRKSVHAAVGGYDETIRGGLEDWDFWLRCADAGHWGATIPEFLDWYRRRPSQNDRWASWDAGERQAAFESGLRRRYARLFGGAWPQPATRRPVAFESLRREVPFENPLTKGARRLLMIVPWLTVGGADKFNLDLVEQLARRGWEITIATTLAGDHSWMHEFARFTPDIFALPHVCRTTDVPAALVHLIRSRRPDAVLVSNSELAYLTLHHLRAMCPEPAYLDFIHMEEEYWKNGGYPRYSVGVADQLDLTVVSSQHLRAWMTARGGDPERIEVCYTNVEPSRWEPAPPQREDTRRELGINHDSPVILYPCRLTAQKQPRVFAKALAVLAARGVGFEAVIAGDGEDRPWLERFFREHGLTERVRTLGAVALDSMPGLMAAADILFLPSRAEGIALVLFEAMAAGLPIVGADVGGQRELVTPECGVLLPYLGDEERESTAYADTLATMIADPMARARMGRSGRARVAAGFTLEKMGQRMESLLNRAIELHKTTPRPTTAKVPAYEAATRAVEYLRVSESCDRLWHERRAELEWIEASRPFRFVQRARSTPVYRALERLFTQRSPQGAAPPADADARWARIKSGRVNQAIRILLRTADHARRAPGRP